MAQEIRNWQVDQRLTPAEMLAFEESLLIRLNENPRPAEAQPWYFLAECGTAVVLGTGQKHAQEVHRQACERDSVPILRRPSGGGCVLHLPQMLWFSLGVPLDWLPQGAAGGIRATFQDVLQPVCRVLQARLGLQAELQGISDLALPASNPDAPGGGWRKIAGSAQCRKQRAVLTHGTLLIDADLRQLPVYLREPEKQPDYRARRSHLDFVVNLKSVAPPFTVPALMDAIAAAWLEMLAGQTGSLQVTRAAPGEADLAATRALVAAKYAAPEWTFRL